jgi:hypothetical protein
MKRGAGRGGFTPLGRKDVERRPDLPAGAPVLRVRVQQPAH